MESFINKENYACSYPPHSGLTSKRSRKRKLVLTRKAVKKPKFDVDCQKITRRTNFKTLAETELKKLIMKDKTFKNIPVFHNVICIEGNIGCGKSTLLKNLELQGFDVLQEPVNNCWNKYLPLLYEDVSRWGMTFQTEVLLWFEKIRRVLLPKLEERNSANKPIIIERSTQSSWNIFFANMVDNKLLTEWEIEVFKRGYLSLAWKPGKSIYLSTPVDVCCQRIKIRNRESEKSVPRDLIQALHEKHQNVFGMKSARNHIVDASQGAQQVAQEVLQIIRNEM